MNSRDATNYLKGFAILAVLVNHCTNAYIADSWGGYANSVISVFFVLSGYGLYHSFIKQVDKPASDLYFSFLSKRFLRIYPLFWISYILHGFPDGILGFFALDFIDPAKLWFVPAIVQCYILAPILFLLVHRTTNKVGFTAISILLVCVNILLFASGIVPVRTIAFQEIFFLPILQFYFGLLLAKIQRHLAFNKLAVGLSFLSTAYLVHETTPHGFIHFWGSDYVFGILLTISTVVLCGAMISSKIELPFKKTLAFVGTYSYAIYLFHGVQFRVLSALGFQQHGQTELLGLSLWLLILPFFILVYAATETIVNELVFGKRDFKRAFATLTSQLRPNVRSLNT